MNKEHVSNDVLIRRADVIKNVLDSRGIPNDHEKEYAFITKHRPGLHRLTRMEMKRGDLLGTYPDVVEAALGIEEDMQENIHLRSISYKIVNRRESGANLPKEIIIYVNRK